MHDIALIALDLDGTLMGHDGSISADNRQALLDCLHHGIHVYAVSGRPYSFARMIADRISEEMGVIAANGGIYEIAPTCVQQPIDRDALAFVIDQADAFGVSLFLKGVHDYYANGPYDARFLYDAMNASFRKDLQVVSHVDCSAQQLKEQAHDILKILAFQEDADRMQEYRRCLEDSDLVTVTDYRPISFDITAKAVDKGSALRRVCAALNLSQQQVMACGDANNDRAMFDAAGWTVAMSNALPAIQQRCDCVVENEDGCGVARAVYDYVLSANEAHPSSDPRPARRSIAGS